MTNLIVVDDREHWPEEIAGARVVDALTYLTAEEFSRGRGLRVFNLCASYRYQQYGYYVSLLATARGQRPLPDVATIQDLKTRTLPRLASDDLDAIIEAIGVSSERVPTDADTDEEPAHRHLPVSEY